MLSEILSGSPIAGAFPDLLVGYETSDDAAVYRLNDAQALVATVDFFMPIVDDPFDYGRIAATNALSDVYAMGATPALALAILGVPVGKLSAEVIRRILDGGAAVCAAAGVPIAGGHSIDAPEPMYGLVALGLAHPSRIKRNVGARAGDVLILGKPLGIGILGAALKKGELRDKAYDQMVEITTQLNTPGVALAQLDGVHAMTDVTGFGLLGHLVEICRGSAVGAIVDFGALPILSSALHIAQQGYATGASARNWASFGAEVELPPGLAPWQQNLLTDPQTSGGLLVACAEADAERVLGVFREQGFGHARVIGNFVPGPARIRIR